MKQEKRPVSLLSSLPMLLALSLALVFTSNNYLLMPERLYVGLHVFLILGFFFNVYLVVKFVRYRKKELEESRNKKNRRKTNSR